MAKEAKPLEWEFNDVHIEYPVRHRRFQKQKVEKTLEPGASESQSDFVSRCIGEAVGGGMDQDEASGMCYDKWRAKKSLQVGTARELARAGKVYKGIRLYVQSTGEWPSERVFAALIAQANLADNPDYYRKLTKAGL